MMSNEKQIEEMAQEIAHCCVDLVESGCLDECCYACLAKKLTAKGYRKQSEGEWIVNAWSEKSQKWIVIPYIKHQHIDPFCSLCKSHALLDGAEFGVASNFCPNCGAKMKGV